MLSNFFQVIPKNKQLEKHKYKKTEEKHTSQTDGSKRSQNRRQMSEIFVDNVERSHRDFSRGFILKMFVLVVKNEIARGGRPRKPGKRQCRKRKIFQFFTAKIVHYYFLIHLVN